MESGHQPSFVSLIRFASAHPKWWLTAKIAITAIPAVTIAYVAVKWSQNPLPYQELLRNLLEANPLVTFICIATPAVLPHLFTHIDREVSKAKDADATQGIISAALIGGLNNLVGTKLRRFSMYLKTMTGAETKGDAFQAITQPESQFTTILETLHHLLQLTLKDKSLQLVLVRVVNKLPHEFTARFPNSIQLPATFLSVDAPKTMFHFCVREGKPLIIPDIEDYLKKTKPKKRHYISTGNPDNDRGSILCRPLYCDTTGQVEYVLSIKSDYASVITDAFSKRYAVPVESIMTRLLLEHNLLLIKRSAK